MCPEDKVVPVRNIEIFEDLHYSASRNPVCARTLHINVRHGDKNQRTGNDSIAINGVANVELGDPRCKRVGYCPKECE